MTQWDGHERRKPSQDGRAGRRPYDQHCGQHDILWAHHDEDRKQHREITCGKIAKLDAELAHEVEKLELAIESIRQTVIGKYWFRVVVGFLAASIIGLGFQQNWAFREILENQREFSVAVNNIENKQIEMTRQISSVEGNIKSLTERQDVLRNQNIKIMDHLKLKAD